MDAADAAARTALLRVPLGGGPSSRGGASGRGAVSSTGVFWANDRSRRPRTSSAAASLRLVAATASDRSAGLLPRFTGVLGVWLGSHSLLARRILLRRVDRPPRVALPYLADRRGLDIG